MVGTFGSEAMRSSVCTASTLRLLALATAVDSDIAITVPASIACAIGPAPVNGTCTPSALIAESADRMPRCGCVPGPGEA